MSFLGKEGFVWWIGVVENRMDPKYLGRCQVRILGWHTADKAVLPTESLPWCMPIQPITSAAQTGVGISPTGPVEGTWVFGFYRDGLEGQSPMMLGTMGGIPEEAAKINTGFNDPRLDLDPAPIAVGPAGKPVQVKKKLIDAPRDPDYDSTIYGPGRRVVLKNRGGNSDTYISTYPDIRYLNEPTTPRTARGREPSAQNYQSDSGQFLPLEGPIYSKKLSRITNVKRAKGGVPPNKSSSFDEPFNEFAALYPYNHVQQSESGHLIEVDDTPKHERLHWFHRSGSYKEMLADGDVVNKSVGDSHDFTTHNNFESIGNEKNSNIGASYELFVNSLNSTDNDFYVRVGAQSDAIIKTIDGNIQLDAGNKEIEFRAGTIATTFTKDLVTSTEQDYTINARNYIHDVQGDTTIDSNGATNISGSPVSLTSSSNFVSIVAQNMTQDVAESSIENIQTTPPAIPPTYAKEINATTGKIKLESIDTTVSGGIEFVLGSSSLNAIAGSIKIEASPNKPGTIALDSLLGDINITASKGDVETIVTAGDYLVTTSKGDISFDALTGLVDLRARSSTVDFTAGKEMTLKSTTEILNDAQTVSLKAQAVSLGKQQASEAMILGNVYMEKFGVHYHATGTGPSGPVNNAGQFTTTLSKKVFGS